MKQRTVFTFQKCGGQSPKWLGKCPDCGAWNSMAEEAVVTVYDSKFGVLKWRKQWQKKGTSVPTAARNT